MTFNHIKTLVLGWFLVWLVASPVTSNTIQVSDVQAIRDKREIVNSSNSIE